MYTNYTNYKCDKENENDNSPWWIPSFFFLVEGADKLYTVVKRVYQLHKQQVIRNKVLLMIKQMEIPHMVTFSWEKKVPLQRTDQKRTEKRG